MSEATQGLLIAQPVEEAVAEAKAVLAVALAEHDPVATIALFSGGNDSTVMTHLLRGEVDAAAHINTGTGIPETTQFVKDCCEEWGLPLHELVTPPEVYESFVLGGVKPDGTAFPGKGFPGPSGHNAVYWWLKQRRLRELRNSLVTKRGQRVVFVTGVRSHESKRRASGSAATRREGSIVWVNAIAHFDTRLMNEYREEHNVPRNPVADLLHRSGECLCGAYAKAGELDEIALWYPETAERIRDLERRAKAAGIARCGWGGGDRRPSKRPPGPLCHDCTLFEVTP